MSQKIRVLHVAFNDLGNGGIQNQIMAIAKLSDKDVTNDVLVWSTKPAFYDKEFEKYGKIIRKTHYEGKSYIKRKCDFFTRYFRVKKAVYETIINNGPYDVIHSHKLFESAASLAAAFKAGVPIRIAHAHLTEAKGYKLTPVRLIIKWYNSIYRLIIRKYATNMIGCSRKAADYVFGNGYGEVVHIGINLEKFNRNHYQRRSNNKKRILHVGSFSVHKNQLFLVDILNELRKIENNVELVMIGRECDYKMAVIDRIKSNRLNEMVVFKPHDVDIAQEMADSDVFAFPSNYEGFGIVLIEAQAMGLRCTASTEVPDETDCGLIDYLELSKGPEYWAKRISELLHSKPENVVADVSEFSDITMVHNMMRIYKGAEKT